MGRGSGELRTGGEKWFGSPVSSVRGIWIRDGWVGGWADSETEWNWVVVRCE